MAPHGLQTRTSKEKMYVHFKSKCTIKQYQCIIESLKMEPIAILKSDQFYALSMRLTELFVSKDMLVRSPQLQSLQSMRIKNYILISSSRM